MGTQIIKLTDWAYIAGFLDGDGSIMVQIKNRPEARIEWRLMFTVCFYQDSRHKKSLKWIQDKIGIGYLSDRNDKITELRINGYEQVENILLKVKPFVKFKSKQTTVVLKILSLISGRNFVQLPRKTRLEIENLICELRNENYFSSNRKYRKNDLRKLFGF